MFIFDNNAFFLSKIISVVERTILDISHIHSISGEVTVA